MPRKKQVDEEVEFDPVPFEDTEVVVSEFTLNTELGRADLNENFRKIQDVINELRNNG